MAHIGQKIGFKKILRLDDKVYMFYISLLCFILLDNIIEIIF